MKLISVLKLKSILIGCKDDLLINYGYLSLVENNLIDGLVLPNVKK